MSNRTPDDIRWSELREMAPGEHENVHGLWPGDKALRRNTHDRWVEFTVNETYMPLIQEFPEDYKPLPAQTEENK